MSFVEAIRAVFGDFFGFYGRAKRAEFWWWVLFRVFVIGAAYGIIAGLRAFGSGSFVVAFLESIVAAIPAVMVVADVGVISRRMHDVGLSARWLWIPGLAVIALVLPALCAIVLHVFELEVPEVAWLPAAMQGAKYVAIGGAAVVLALMFLPSRPVANRYDAPAPQWKVDGTNAWAFVLPFLVLLFVFNILVYARGFHLSLTDAQGINEGDFIGLQNYRDALYADKLIYPDFYRAIKVTFFYTGGCLLTQVPAAFILAYILNTIPFLRIRAVLRAAFFLPCLINTVIIGFLFRMFFNPNQGIINHVIGWFGFHEAAKTEWLMHSQYAIPLLIIVSFWQWTGFHMVYFLAQLQTIDPTLYEAAKMDGISPGGQLLHITIPLMRPAITFVAVTAAIGGLQVFDLVFMLFPNAGFGPGGVAKTLVAEIYDVGFSQQQALGLASAIGFLTFFIIAGVSALQIRFLGLGRHGEA